MFFSTWLWVTNVTSDDSLGDLGALERPIADLTYEQRIQQMHQDIVFSVPPNVISLGSSPRCEVQGMYAARRFITVQGHPEYNEAIVKEIVNIRTRAGVFKAEFAQDALDRAGKDHDGLGIATVFLKFLLEE